MANLDVPAIVQIEDDTIMAMQGESLVPVDKFFDWLESGVFKHEYERLHANAMANLEENVVQQMRRYANHGTPATDILEAELDLSPTLSDVFKHGLHGRNAI